MNTPANNPRCTDSAAHSVEFGTSADGFPVARIGEILLGLISNESGDVFLASAWRFTKPLSEARLRHFYRHDGRVDNEAAFRLRAIEPAEHMAELEVRPRPDPHGSKHALGRIAAGHYPRRGNCQATLRQDTVASIFLPIETFWSTLPFAAQVVGTKRIASGRSSP
jgi:hypothetical protein